MDGRREDMTKHEMELYIIELGDEIKELGDEIERLTRELKLAQAGWRSGDADEFINATVEAVNATGVES